MCDCVACPHCHGSGTGWYTGRGVYLGQSPGDELDDLGECPYCEGAGYDICRECYQDEEDRYTG